MPMEITMPKLSDTMTDGTLVHWLKKEKDKVQPGDIIAEVETDKATQELEAFEPGTIAKIVVREGTKVPVGGVIVVLAGPDEDAEAVAKAYVVKPVPVEAVKDSSATAAPAPIPAPAPPPVAPAPVPAPSSAGSTGGGQRRRVSPLARKIAEEKGVDLAAVAGSGPDGRIIKRDVLAAAETVPPAGAAPRPIPGTSRLEAKTMALSNVRQTIARRLLEAKQTIPHFYVSIDVVMEALLDLRKSANEQLAPAKLSVTDFIARAVAVALTQTPAVNASFSSTAIVRHGTVHLGIAVAVDDGLVVPVIRDAQTKDLRQISAEIRQLAELARTHKLKANQLTGGTFTISNLGMYGVRDFMAIINPPEAAILAVGATEARPIVRGAQVVPAQVMTLSLSADHRVVDGATASEFLSKLKAILENPLAMLV